MVDVDVTRGFRRMMNVRHHFVGARRRVRRGRARQEQGAGGHRDGARPCALVHDPSGREAGGSPARLRGASIAPGRPHNERDGESHRQRDGVPLPHPAAPRGRRHGRGLPGGGPAAAPAGRAQDAPRRRRRGRPQPAAARGTRGLRAEPSEHRGHLRDRRDGRGGRAAQLHRHGVRGRTDALPVRARPSPGRARSSGAGAPGRGGPGRGPRPRRRASRRQVLERDGHGEPS